MFGETWMTPVEVFCEIIEILDREPKVLNGYPSPVYMIVCIQAYRDKNGSIFPTILLIIGSTAEIAFRFASKFRNRPHNPRHNG